MIKWAPTLSDVVKSKKTKKFTTLESRMIPLPTSLLSLIHIQMCIRDRNTATSKWDIKGKQNTNMNKNNTLNFNSFKQINNNNNSIYNNINNRDENVDSSNFVNVMNMTANMNINGYTNGNGFKMQNKSGNDVSQIMKLKSFDS